MTEPAESAESAEPERTLHYADDISAADVDALAAFIDDRLKALATRHRGQLEEQRATLGLVNVTHHLMSSLRHHLEQRSARPDEASTESFDRRLDIQRDWNLLCEAVSPWRDAEGYDSARWHHLQHLDAAARARHEALAAGADSETAAENATGRGQGAPA
ncbi:hypothetical protein [Streptomyces sp. RKAG293]|uniref:hypothetical protein n=1 Tax=Streptomyces sp. RKAG293 TaxID=2893403 RepID=UPI002034517D|nr:hypothetical protein [Streptomyces sp. RKAG293]MCM2423800.1 hypothetical protein [Streptomyces sp. RKAG293]